MDVIAASSGPSAYWYMTRSTGAVAMVLLSLTVALGVIDVKRISSPAWPRFVVDRLHRNLALLTLVFLALHILTSALDSFASIPLIDSIVPFVGSYRPFWLGLGAVAFDMLVAVVVTSLLRRRVGNTLWRRIHWLSYASWPIALLHGLGTGSDVKTAWLQLVTIACLALVLASVVFRAASGWPANAGSRTAAFAAVAGFALFLLVWVPGGPLGSEWARRSGTPGTLLRHKAPASKQGRDE
jgi:predicted ferric reductase